MRALAALLTVAMVLGMVAVGLLLLGAWWDPATIEDTFGGMR